jgi:hypothetical protein
MVWQWPRQFAGSRRRSGPAAAAAKRKTRAHTILAIRRRRRKAQPPAISWWCLGDRWGKERENVPGRPRIPQPATDDGPRGSESRESGAIRGLPRCGHRFHCQLVGVTALFCRYSASLPVRWPRSAIPLFLGSMPTRASKTGYTAIS